MLRDLPLLQGGGGGPDVRANLSVPTIDEKAWRATEPHTPNPRARLEAVAELNRRRDPVGRPDRSADAGINDEPEQVEKILELATEAGATGIGGIALHLRGDVRDVFFDWLRSQRPDLVPRYEELYRAGRTCRRNGGADRAPGRRALGRPRHRALAAPRSRRRRT